MEKAVAPVAVPPRDLPPLGALIQQGLPSDALGADFVCSSPLVFASSIGTFVDTAVWGRLHELYFGGVTEEQRSALEALRGVQGHGGVVTRCGGYLRHGRPPWQRRC